MNMLFKNTTKYSKECYENFLIFHNKKFGVSSNFYTLLIVILMAFCIVLQLKAGNTQLAFIFILVVYVNFGSAKNLFELFLLFSKIFSKILKFLKEKSLGIKQKNSF